MSLQGSAKTDIKLEAVDVYWGTERCRKITLVDDVAGSLTDEYFDLNAIGTDLATETQYYVLLSGTTPAVDPAPAGKTKIEVTYADGDSAATIAALIETAVEAFDFDAVVTGSDIQIANKYLGKVTEEAYTNAPSLTFVEEIAGIGGSLGATAQGGSTLNMEATSVDLVSDQTGSIVLGQVYTGSTASVDMSLIEMTKERWEAVVGSVTGDIFTPTAGTRLVGYGESRLYQNLFDLGGKLVLHPIRLAASDRSEDIVFWKSSPLPSSIAYSGQDIQGMEISFTAYNDKSKPSEISLFAQGDWQQDLV